MRTVFRKELYGITTSERLGRPPVGDKIRECALSAVIGAVFPGRLQDITTLKQLEPVNHRILDFALSRVMSAVFQYPT
jgi:hypothetical protein